MPSGLYIGKTSLGDVVRLTAIIDRRINPTDLLKLYEGGVRILEFRIDSFPEDNETVFSYIKSVRSERLLRERF
ncbi:MAG: hypothetical protein KDK27_21045, partial [Leptospiraceae bacterium]|nr:hypothetical protein [Leptospiraceae bacterium]